MTNEEKKEILLNAINAIEKLPDNRFCFGLCWAIALTDTNWPPTKESEFGIELPPPAYGYFHDYSFPLNKVGDALRIALLEEAIKKLEL